MVTPTDTTLLAGQYLTIYIEPYLQYGIDSISYNGEELSIDSSWYQGPYYVALDAYVTENINLFIKFKSINTSINNRLDNYQILVYPNPTNGIINLSIPNEIIEYKLLIVKQSGMVLFNDPKYKKRDVDISNFPPGIYIVSIEFNNTRLSYPIIKQ